MSDLEKKEEELRKQLEELEIQKEEEAIKELRKTYVGNYYKISGNDICKGDKWKMYFYVKDVWSEDTLMCDKIYINLHPKDYKNAIHIDTYEMLEFDDGKGWGLAWQSKQKITKKQYLDAFKKAQEHINKSYEDAKSDKWFSEK